MCSARNDFCAHRVGPQFSCGSSARHGPRHAPRVPLADAAKHLWRSALRLLHHDPVTLAHEVLRYFAGGGDLQRDPVSDHRPRFWASRFRGGRSRVRAPSDGQRIGLRDRLAWSFRAERLRVAPLELTEGRPPVHRICTRSAVDHQRFLKPRGPDTGRITLVAYTGGCPGGRRDGYRPVSLNIRCRALRTPETSAHTAPPPGRDPAAVPFSPQAVVGLAHAGSLPDPPRVPLQWHVRCAARGRSSSPDPRTGGTPCALPRSRSPWRP